MPCTQPIPLIKVDVKKAPADQEKPCHNRWHPEIPAVATVKDGVTFTMEMVDWTGGQIKDNDSAEDMRDVDLTSVHNLSGPIRVEDASGQPALPGDLLCVEICDLSALPGDAWGFTGVFDRDNGGGFLTDHFPCAAKAIWQLDGVYATSRHIPGVKFAGIIHPGLIGTAPSHELLKIWNDRERGLVSGAPPPLAEVCHTRPLALVPLAKGAVLGGIKPGSADFERIAAEAARTIPGRENGGNCDIKNLSRGSKVYLPVFVEGANLSAGDMHFSQGDGEVSFCGAIEMSGVLTLKCSIIRGGMATYLTPMGPTPLHVHPIFEIGPLEPRYSEWLVFEGLSVDETGKQHFMDATVAYKRAVLNCIDYLHKFGWSREQIYLLLSACPCEGRLSGIVDVPNACATIAIPIAIFDVDIRPKLDGPPGAPNVGPKIVRVPRGQACICAYKGTQKTFVNPSAVYMS